MTDYDRNLTRSGTSKYDNRSRVLTCSSNYISEPFQMTMVEPGGFATRGATPESLVQTPVHPAYSDPKLTVQYIRGYLPNVALPGDTEKGISSLFFRLI